MREMSLGEKKNKRSSIRIASLAVAVMCLFAALYLPFSLVRARAAQDEKEYDYYVYIGDYADLLTDDEETELYNTMVYGTEYGNMVFMTTDYTEGYSTKDYIEKLYQTDENLKGTNAVFFMIDMDNRMLWITGYGDNKKMITPDYANLITDNIYKYAGSGDYYSCAMEGFEQINRRLSGSRLEGSLRGIGNMCIAVIIAEILCFAFAYVTSAAKKADADQILDNIERVVNIKNPTVKKTGTRKVYDPVRSSSSGSSGGGGGGGFSGGGGGHGF